MGRKKVNTINLAHNGAQSIWEVYKTDDGWTAFSENLNYKGLEFSSGVSGSTQAELHEKMRGALENIINFVKNDSPLDI